MGLREVRGAHTATLLSDGRVLVVGGVSTKDGEADYLATAEVWVPATATFGPAGSLSEGRLGHTTTLLLDGRVLVVAPWDHQVRQSSGSFPLTSLVKLIVSLDRQVTHRGRLTKSPTTHC